MTVEELLVDALHGADDYAPSPDLFARVQRSIEEAAAHRRRVTRALGFIAVGLAVAAGWVIGFLEVRDGVATMPWWTLEILTIVAMIALVVALGPLIRRFGRVLTEDVFRSNPATSARFLSVLDIAYYLIFSAYILMSTVFSPDPEWGGTLAGQVDGELTRVGFLLLIMGVLHALTIAVLPVIGLIFASTWRREARRLLGAGAPAPHPDAERADRLASVIVWTVLGLLTAGGALFILPGLLGLILGAG